MTLGPTLKMGGVIGVIAIVCGFWLWFFLTCCILIAMEGCSAMVCFPLAPPTRSWSCDGTNAHHSCTLFVCSGSRRSPSTPSSRATCSRRFLSLRCWRRTRGWRAPSGSMRRSTPPKAETSTTPCCGGKMTSCSISRYLQKIFACMRSNRDLAPEAAEKDIPCPQCAGRGCPLFVYVMPVFPGPFPGCPWGPP